MGALNLSRLVPEESTNTRQWRSWLARLRCPELSVRELLPPHARLVIVVSERGEEVLASGGLINIHETQGGQVLAVSSAEGEATPGKAFVGLRPSPVIPHHVELPLQSPEFAPCSMIPVTLSDQQVQQQADLLRDKLVRLLRPGDVVVNTWEHDRHPVHASIAQVARTSCMAIGCTSLSAPLRMWDWATPGDDRIPWPRLRALPLEASDSRRKQTAFQSHRSQLVPFGDPPGDKLNNAIEERATWRTEYYFI